METETFAFYEVTTGTPDFWEYLRIRHEVFGRELHGPHPHATVSDKGLRMEIDRFDPYSRHFLGIHVPTGLPAACARLILPNPLGLNVTGRYVIDRHPFPDANGTNTGEISRMAISNRFRRIRTATGKGPVGDQGPHQRRSHDPGVTMGLYRELYRVAREENVPFCVAAMEAVFSRLLRTVGLPFVPVGPTKWRDHPPRRPYIISSATIQSELAQRNPRLLRYLHHQAA